MSDRPGTQPSGEQDDHDLDYLDAAVTESFDEDRPAGEPVTAGYPADATEPARSEPPVQETTAVTAPPPTRTVVVEKRSASESTWYWPAINVASLLAMIGVGFLANLLPFNDMTTAEVASSNEVPFQPSGWFFKSIVALVPVLLVLYVLYGLLPGGRRNDRLQRTSQFFLLANVAVIAWLLFWHWEQFAASMVCLLLVLVALLFMYFGLRVRNPLRRSSAEDRPGLWRRLVTWLPFSLYLGVATILALTNLMMWLRDADWEGGPLSYTWWAVVFMAGVTLVAAAFGLLARDIVVPLALGIGLFAVAQHIWDDSTLASVLAVILAVACVGVAGLAWIMDYDRTNNRNPFGRSSGTPPPMTPVE